MLFLYRCLFSDGSGECMLFCGGKLVQIVLNLSQLDWAGFNQTVAESGQLVYNRPNRFTQKMDLSRQEGVRSSRTSTHFVSPLKFWPNVYKKYFVNVISLY